MGNCDFKKEEPAPSVTISKVNFQMHYVIGRGGYGKVKFHNKIVAINLKFAFKYRCGK